MTSKRVWRHLTIWYLLWGMLVSQSFSSFSIREQNLKMSMSCPLSLKLVLRRLMVALLNFSVIPFRRLKSRLMIVAAVVLGENALLALMTLLLPEVFRFEILLCSILFARNYI